MIVKYKKYKLMLFLIRFKILAVIPSFSTRLHPSDLRCTSGLAFDLALSFTAVFSANL